MRIENQCKQNRPYGYLKSKAWTCDRKGWRILSEKALNMELEGQRPVSRPKKSWKMGMDKHLELIKSLGSEKTGNKHEQNTR